MLSDVGEATRTPGLSLRRRLHSPLCYTNIFKNLLINKLKKHIKLVVWRYATYYLGGGHSILLSYSDMKLALIINTSLQPNCSFETSAYCRFSEQVFLINAHTKRNIIAHQFHSIHTLFSILILQ